MQSRLISAPCPGFGIRVCMHCKKPWLTTASELCGMIVQYCPICIPLIMPVLRPWELNPDRRPAEERIQARLDELRRKRELKVQEQRKAIRKARRSA